MIPKYNIGTVVKTSAGLFEIESIIISKDDVSYQAKDQTFSEIEVLNTYAIILPKPEPKKRVRRKKAIMPSVTPSELNIEGL